MIDRFLIFGASGDLTRRYLMPALARLHHHGHLPDSLAVIGVGPDDWSDGRFRQAVTPGLPTGVRPGFADRLVWRRADVTVPDQLREVVRAGDGAAVIYLALPPAVYPATLAALRAVGLPDGSRLVVEKPFGTDQASARRLNQAITALLPESSVFRVDHFLAKQTVQNVLGLRFANRIFEPLWNRAHVARVEIRWDETLGLEGRAGYYDHTGALRDMLQNHLLQLLALVAMEPPVTLSERDLRDRKVDVLRATRAEGPSVRARYTAGTAGGQALPDYTREEGVDPARETETYAEVTLVVDNWRWAGVPFVLRSGKALARDRAEIAIHFQPVPHSAFAPSDPARPNVLRLVVDPDRITLNLNLNGAGDPFTLEPAELDADLAPQDLPAYARLLLDVMAGDPTLSIRADEAEEAWRVVEPILARWRRGEVPMLTYPAGSTGPSAA